MPPRQKQQHKQQQQQQQQHDPAERTAFLAHAQELAKAERFRDLVPLVAKAAPHLRADPAVQRLAVVALIRLDRYADALALLDHPDRGTPDAAPYERAYCLYRVNRLDDALAQLATLPGAPKVLLLRAQVLYRLEQYDECLAVYDAVVATTSESDPLMDDLLTNRQAVHASAQLARLAYDRHTAFVPTTTPADAADADAEFASYEHAYNYATTALAHGHLPHALEHLELARRMAMAALAGELSPTELAAEVLPVLVQIAVANQLMGNVAAAESMYRYVAGLPGAVHGPDWAVAVNNLAGIEAASAAASAGSDAADLAKRYRKIRKAVAADRMPSWQRAVIELNEAAVHGFKDPVDGAIATAYPALVAALTAIARGQAVPELDHGDDSADLVSVLLSLHRELGQHAQSPTGSLAVLDTDRLAHVPAVAALRARIHLGVERQPDAAVAAVLSVPETAVSRHAAAVAAARIAVAAGDREAAVNAWENAVRASHGASGLSVAAWVAAMARTDAARAEDVAEQQQLASVASTTAAVSAARNDGDDDAMDVDDWALEDIEAAWSRATRTTTTTPATTTATATIAAESLAKSRKRKPRYPKGYDPASEAARAYVPDPERWIPKRLRASTLAAAAAAAAKRSKRVRGKQAAAAALATSSHQGGPVLDDPNPAPAMAGIGGTGSANIFGKSKDKPVAAAHAAPVLEEQPAVPEPAAAAVPEMAPKPTAGKPKPKPKGKGKGRR